MSAPETTSAENLRHYFGGKCVAASHGKAWSDIQAAIIAVAPAGETLNIPAVNEPFLLWITSGEAEIQEREDGGPWMTSRVKKGSFFFTTAGAPYDCRWQTLTPEPFACMLVLLELPLFKRALKEVCGTHANLAQPRDVSGFADEVLDSLLQHIQHELLRRKASPLLVQGIAQAIAIHLARNYATLQEKSPPGNTSLPTYKLRRITSWMQQNLAMEFNLDQLAAQAGLSKFHFDRLFKSTMGVTPLHYYIHLRMNAARRLLRETKKNVVDIALDVGYTNPSHFAHLFRRETGLSPSHYRRQS